MNELRQDDIEFLNSLGSQLGRNEVVDDALASLRVVAATGDPTAIRLVEVVEAAEATKHLFDPELKDMMMQAVTMIRLQCPILNAMASADEEFLAQLAGTLDGVMRDAFARGWLAHRTKAED